MTSQPHDLKSRLSALDEKRGPSIVTQVPLECITTLVSLAAFSKQDRVSWQKGSATGKWQMPGYKSQVPS